MSPVYKGSNKKLSDPASYRPVSLTCIACRLFERLIKEQIMDHLASHDLISSHQHGFRTNRSTESQLLECVNDWTLSLDAKESIDVLYLDTAKAFDTVSHRKLLFKLTQYGIHGSILNWIRAFLSSRSQAVRVNGSLSSYTDVSSGVPQGSVLGPVLFLVYINDLVDICKYSSLKLFADDSKLYFKCTRDVDFQKLSDDAEAVFRWMEINQLKVALEKCSVLHLGGSNMQRPLVIENSLVPSVDTIRDIGVFMSHDLKFSVHSSYVAHKAFTISNLFFRVFRCRDRGFLNQFYKTYIRPLVESATSVWNPYLIKDIDLVEKVQRKFTKRFPGLFKLSYKERRDVLDLDTLELRRLHRDLTQCYNIIHGNVDLNYNDFFELNNNHLRGHSQKLVVRRARLNCRKYSFSNRVVPTWNSLPQEVIDSSSVHVFKNKLRSVNFDQFLRYSD